jgi:mono/diheme cytochrome c family protein
VKKFRPLMNADKRGLKMLVLSALIRVNLRPDSIFSQLLRERFWPAILLAAATLASAASPPTFNKDVLPIFQKNCQVCHRPGEIGPMPLLTYADARPWARAIKLAVATRKMPPWFADPAYGHFQNERALSEQDVRTIESWVDAGAPEGDPKDKPLPIVWKDGWNIRPDAIFQMPDPYTVPPTGTLDYLYVVIPTGLTSDTWVTAAEIRPGTPSVVHHVLAVVRPPGSEWLKEARPFVPYMPRLADAESGKSSDPQSKPVDMSYELLAAYSPGMQAQRFDIDRSAKLIPAGSDIVLQVHYTPNGKMPVADQTRVGITLAGDAPPKRFFSAVAASANWTIAAGDANAEGRARLTFGEPVELVYVQPHMHVRGKDMTVRLTFPDGRSETVLSVPRYDFHWQIVYYLDKPLHLPQGTRVEAIAHWDNSATNPNNPDPAATVKYGFQSTDEMLNANMGVIVEQ